MDEIDKIASSIDDHIKSLLVLENLADRNRFLFNFTKERVENCVKKADNGNGVVLKTDFDPNLQVLQSFLVRGPLVLRTSFNSKAPAFTATNVKLMPSDRLTGTTSMYQFNPRNNSLFANSLDSKLANRAVASF